MPETIEEMLCTELRAILAPLAVGEEIPNSEDLRWAMSTLERFLPDVLGEIHPEGKEELDGVVPWVATKAGELEAEIFGMVYLMSDQAAAPAHLRLQVAIEANEVCWMEYRLGEKTERGMDRGHHSSAKWQARLRSLGPKKIDWMYRVTFGTRRVD